MIDFDSKMLAIVTVNNEQTTRWRSVAGEVFQTPHTYELVVFESFFVQGFGVPTHPFLHDLLQYYKISLYHLNPNSILHIFIFINLCEAIEPPTWGPLL